MRLVTRRFELSFCSEPTKWEYLKRADSTQLLQQHMLPISMCGSYMPQTCCSHRIVLCDVHSAQSIRFLIQAGVFFAKGYRVTRLWRIDEEGSFPTLDRSSQGSNLKKTLPRIFGPANPHFTECRGVVFSHNQTGEEVREESISPSTIAVYR